MVYIDVALEFWKLQVENDATERGVQLGHAYLGRTKIEEKYQNILQVVPNQH